MPQLVSYRLLGQNHRTGDVYFVLNGEKWVSELRHFEYIVGRMVQDAVSLGIADRRRREAIRDGDPAEFANDVEQFLRERNDRPK